MQAFPLPRAHSARERCQTAHFVCLPPLAMTGSASAPIQSGPLRAVAEQLFAARLRQIKGSGTPANAGLTTRTKRVRGAPRKERLAPRLPLSGALACRRSTSALPRGVWSLGAIRARFRGTTVQGAGVTPPTAYPTSSDAPRMPVVMPADMMPGPPGSQADEASTRGHRPRPCRPASPGRRPLGRDDLRYVTEQETNVKGRSQ